ncbi:NUDIX domain-containing protein [Bacteroidia bacterium]|nr:NUDIX domain-containing protein [Bacteroidia bacterium]
MIKVFKDDACVQLDDQGWTDYRNQYPLLQAAGGVVFNPNGDLLMILKRGKWDLPKGTLEPNESVEACALREVGEECGITGLQIGDLQTVTHHIYLESNGIEYLKQTFWFAMQCPHCYTPKPQMEEDIEKAEWCTPQQVQQNLENAYASIKDVLNN